MTPDPLEAARCTLESELATVRLEDAEAVDRVCGATHALMRAWVAAQPRGSFDVPTLRRSAGAALWERAVRATGSIPEAVVQHAREVLKLTARVRRTQSPS